MLKLNVIAAVTGISIGAAFALGGPADADTSVKASGVKQSVSLQPLSVQGNKGPNVAAASPR